jgi:tRNA(fMet)-specific endonuclease VapC
MSFLVDTDIISAHLRGAGIVTNRFLLYTGRLYVSVVTIAELKTWVYRKNTAQRYAHSLEAVLRDFHIIPLDDQIADVFGHVGAELQDRGMPLATPDLLIAATALFHGFSVVTHNVHDFARTRAQCYRLDEAVRQDVPSHRSGTAMPR